MCLNAQPVDERCDPASANTAQSLHDPSHQLQSDFSPVTGLQSDLTGLLLVHTCSWNLWTDMSAQCVSLAPSSHSPTGRTRKRRVGCRNRTWIGTKFRTNRGGLYEQSQEPSWAKLPHTTPPSIYALFQAMHKVSSKGCVYVCLIQSTFELNAVEFHASSP